MVAPTPVESLEIQRPRNAVLHQNRKGEGPVGRRGVDGHMCGPTDEAGVGECTWVRMCVYI